MGRRILPLATLALTTVGLVLVLAGGVAAKPSHCAKDCKQDIKSCLALVPNKKSCTGTKAEKKACRRMYAAQRKACQGMVKLCKQQNPSLTGTCVLSSTTTTSTTTTSTATATTSPLLTNTTTSLQTTTTSTTPSTTTTTTTTAPTTTTTTTTHPTTTTASTTPSTTTITTTTAPTTTTTHPTTTTTSTTPSTTTTTAAPTTTTTTSTTTTTTTTLVSSCLPATGQTTCWDSSGTVIPCAGTGQDGDLQKGAPLSYTDNGDGTVTDNNTGLMWEKGSSGDGSVHDVHSFNGQYYTWDQAFSGHVATLNSTSFARHTDWRVPNVRELGSIVNYANAYPAVSQEFNNGCTAPCTVLTCSCTQAYFYWSSSTLFYSNPSAWGVSFDRGERDAPGKSAGFFVRAVRGGSSCLLATGQKTCRDSSGTVIPCAGTGQDGDLQKGAPLSYTNNGDGTVTDVNTGLQWEKLSNGDGSVHDAGKGYTWDQAFKGHVATLNSTSFAGHTDWRLPNAQELGSIVNYANLFPAVSQEFNNGCTAPCTVLTCSCTGSFGYWSSSTRVQYAGEQQAWLQDFSLGGTFSDGKGGTAGVRAVRGGS